jgi:hypothetical protein
MGDIKSFDIKNLLPFHKSGNQVPRSISGKEEEINALDPDLKPEEVAYVRHYLAYADRLLDNSETGSISSDANHPSPAGEEKVVEMPRKEKDKEEAA